MNVVVNAGARESNSREPDTRELDTRELDTRELDAREPDTRELDARESNARESVKNIENLSRVFINAFPSMTPKEQLLALSLYTLLIKARPVSLCCLSSHANLSTAYVEATLKAWSEVYYDADNCITGFLGLTIINTNHQLRVNSSIVYTWCAWDSLFIPELLDTNAVITSQCATSGETITLTVSARGIESVDPGTTVISFVIPSEEALRENVICNFCQHVNFISSPETGREWIQQYPGSFLISLDDAFQIGKKVNRARFSKTLLDHKGIKHEG